MYTFYCHIRFYHPTISDTGVSVKIQDAPNSDSGSNLKPSILQLLSGWLGSVRAEESCHKASCVRIFPPEKMSPNIVSEYFP